MVIERLQQAGFAVAPRPYHERRHHAQREKTHVSIDLETGLVNVWGTKDWLSLDEALGNFSGGAGKVATSSANENTGETAAVEEFAADAGKVATPQMPLNAAHWAWLDRCKRAGFVITSGPSDAANVGAEREGVAYVLLPYTRSILSQGFVHHQLAEFEAPREIVTTGRSSQAALFGGDDA
jgi:hypothetical protein